MAPNRRVTHPGEPSLTSPPRAVLDTNVVLDWLLFEDRSTAAMSGAIRSGRLRWIACDAMRTELAQVLERGLAEARGAEAAQVLRSWDRHANPAPRAPAHPLRCRDAADQVFVDLALAAGARWLLSRDRAVLALRRRAAVLGLTILQPADWQLE